MTINDNMITIGHFVSSSFFITFSLFFLCLFFHFFFTFEQCFFCLFFTFLTFSPFFSLCHFVTLSLCHFVTLFLFFYSRCGRLGAGVEGGEREGGESDGGKAKLTRRGGVRGGGGGARVGVGDGGGE